MAPVLQCPDCGTKHPLGEVPRAQSDFGRGALTVVAAVAAYSWRSGEGEPRQQAGTVDADHVRGLEFSGGVRGHGVSIDAEFEHIAAAAMDRDVTLGLYVDGRAAIDKMSVEGGYMVIPRRLEPLLGFDTASSPSYDEPWTDRVLDLYAGDTVIYVGEGAGGCTGTGRMHALLGDEAYCWHDLPDAHCHCGVGTAARFKQVADVEIPQWWGIHDRLGVYRRLPAVA